MAGGLTEVLRGNNREEGEEEGINKEPHTLQEEKKGQEKQGAEHRPQRSGSNQMGSTMIGQKPKGMNEQPKNR